MLKPVKAAAGRTERKSDENYCHSAPLRLFCPQALGPGVNVFTIACWCVSDRGTWKEMTYEKERKREREREREGGLKRGQGWWTLSLSLSLTLSPSFSLFLWLHLANFALSHCLYSKAFQSCQEATVSLSKWSPADKFKISHF